MWWNDAKNLSKNQEIKWDWASVALVALCSVTFIFSLKGIIVDDYHPAIFMPSLIGIFIGVLNIKQIVVVRDVKDTRQA